MEKDKKIVEDNNEERLKIEKIKKCQKKSNMYNILGAVSMAFGTLSGVFSGCLIGNGIVGKYLFGEPGASYTIAGLLAVILFLLDIPVKSHCDVMSIINHIEALDLANRLNYENEKTI